MKRIGLLSALAFFCIYDSAWSQTVTQVNGQQATVRLEQGQGFAVGDKVIFLNAGLNEAGRGRLHKLSPNGTQAVVQITSGKISKGMLVEKTADSTAKRPLSYQDLNEEERRILQNGPVSDARYIFGGILGTYPAMGFGIGHAVQGRYSTRGWVFTVGELASVAVLAAGVGSCVDGWRWGENNDHHSCNAGLITLGAFSFIGFRIWEIIDLWAVPPSLNRRYREIKGRLGEPVVSFEPLFLPTEDGARLGLRLRF